MHNTVQVQQHEPTLLQLKLGSKAKVQPAEYGELANVTDGYSGTCIAVGAQTALMEPVRLVQNAKFYSVAAKPSRAFYLNQYRHALCVQTMCWRWTFRHSRREEG